MERESRLCSQRIRTSVSRSVETTDRHEVRLISDRDRHILSRNCTLQNLLENRERIAGVRQEKQKTNAMTV